MPDQAPRTHECPAPGCVRRVPRHQFACPADWYRLPVEIRRAINDGFRRDWSMWAEAAEKATSWYERQVTP